MPGFFGGYRVKKRMFAVAGIALAVSLATAGMIALYASTLLGSNALVRFQLTRDPQALLMPGSGVSISRTPVRNLIQDGSFEPVVYRHFLTAYGGDSQSLTASSEDAGTDPFSEGFFVDATVRVMGQTADGLSLKKSARVTEYGLNQVGVFQSIRLPADMPAGRTVNALSRWQDQVIAVGRSGLIMLIEANQVSALPDAGIQADLTDVCVSEDGILIVSEKGDIAFSEDALIWQRWRTDAVQSMRAAAAGPEGTYVAVGDQGAILTGQDGQMTAAVSGTKNTLRDVIYHNNGWYAIGDQGTVLYSAGGLVWQDISPDQSDMAWNKAASINGTIVLAGQKGRIAVNGAAGMFEVLETEQTAAQRDLIDLVLLTESQYIALDNSSSFLISHDAGKTWSESGVNTGMVPRLMILAGKDRLISADNTGLIGTAQLVARIELDSPLLEGTFQAGDLIYLETDRDASVNQTDGQNVQNSRLPWIVSENAEAVRLVDSDVPGGAAGVMRLSSDHDAYLSQNIRWETLANQQEGAIFRLSCRLRQENLENPVLVWITGLENTAGTKFRITDQQWRTYDYSFVIPSAWIRQGQDITIHIGFEGSGTLWLDELALIAAADEAFPYTAGYHNQISTVQPSVIRLTNIPLGSPSAVSGAWAVDFDRDIPVFDGQELSIYQGVSLAAGLELARSVGADPWLTVDSGASEIEIANLLEYLAAPVSERYGRLRLEQGAPVPWSDVFSRIYLEVGDAGRLFGDDRLRSSYVDWIIEQVSLSPYYLTLKNTLVFVDGMTYSQGVMQSSADYHAADLTGRPVYSVYDLEEIYFDYWSGKPRNPEKSLQTWPGIIRSVRMASGIAQETDDPNQSGSLSLAELTSLLLFDLGGQTSMSMLEINPQSGKVYPVGDPVQHVWYTAAGIHARAGKGEAYLLERLSANDTVFAMAALDGNRFTAVLCNLGNQPVNCQLAVQDDIAGATVYKYDQNAEFLGSEGLRRNESQITVLPGGVVRIEKILSEPQ